METVAKEVGKPRDDDCAQAEIHLQSRLIPGCLLLRFSELARLRSMELAGCDRVVRGDGSWRSVRHNWSASMQQLITCACTSSIET